MINDMILISMQQTKQQSVYIWGLFNGKQFTVPQKIKELEGKNIVSVATGGNFNLAITANGQLYGWGNVKYSRFGIASQENILFPKLVTLKISVRTISAGNWHSMVIDSNGKLYSAGHNKQGACGIGHFDNADSFTQVVSDLVGKSISCGDCFTFVISNQGYLYSCGHSKYHGHKYKDHLNKLKKIELGGNKVIVADAGFNHSLAVTEQGQTYSWGDGSFLQLGHGGKQDQKEPRAISKLNGVKIIDVSCTRGQKNSHSMALSVDGQVYTWGAGYKGKLGHQSKWTHENAADEAQPRKMQTIKQKITKVSAGGIHSNLLNDNGQILSFGCGSDGRLGHSKSSEYVYLYRQGIPKVIDSLKGVWVQSLQSSYYHNICMGYKR